MVTTKGYQLEEHLVVTADGYKLTLFRFKEPENPGSYCVSFKF
jgi:hypothetical protein